MPLLGLLGAKFKIAALIAAAIALGIVVHLIRKSGKDAARVEGMIAQLDNVRARHEAEDRVAAADDAARQRLRDKWTRR